MVPVGWFNKGKKQMLFIKTFVAIATTYPVISMVIIQLWTSEALGIYPETRGSS